MAAAQAPDLDSTPGTTGPIGANMRYSADLTESMMRDYGHRVPLDVISASCTMSSTSTSTRAVPPSPRP